MKKPEFVKVWDPAVRLLHIGLIVSFAVAYLTQERSYNLHLDSGYVLLGLVFTRILWGFIGTHHARFHNFLTGPRTLFGYLKDLFGGHPRRYLGHNPAGAAMIVCMLLVLTLVSISGIALDAAENRSGPLAQLPLFKYLDQVETIHEVSADLSLVLIAIHIAGVMVSSRLHRENLVAAMLSGRKAAQRPSPASRSGIE